MIKKLIAFSVVLLLPVSFISSASAASKSVTCYKGTASKVIKGNNPKCAKGWSTKKPSINKMSNVPVGSSFKVQAISIDEIEALNLAGNELMKAFSTSRDNYYKCIKTTKNLDDCKNVASPFDLKLKEYLPKEGTTKTKIIYDKIINNFCGLNGGLLSRNLELISKTDPRIGITKYNEVVMKEFYANLESVEKNQLMSINTSSTNGFLVIVFLTKVSPKMVDGAFYPELEIFGESGIYKAYDWQSSLNETEYGISIETREFLNLKTRLENTVRFCNNR